MFLKIVLWNAIISMALFLYVNVFCMEKRKKHGESDKTIH